MKNGNIGGMKGGMFRIVVDCVVTVGCVPVALTVDVSLPGIVDVVEVLVVDPAPVVGVPTKYINAHLVC